MYCTDLIPLDGWVAADRGQPVLETWFRSQWEPGGALFLPKFPQDGALVLCRDSTPKFGANLFYRSLDLVDCFDILCGVGGDDVSWLCVPPRLFYRDLLQQSLSDSGVLGVARVHFDVSGMVLLCDGDSVRYGPGSMMSDATGDGD